MTKETTLTGFSRISPESPNLSPGPSRNALFNLIQKMAGGGATVFISTLPLVSRLLHSSGNHIQMTLTVFFVGSIVGELLAGPVSKVVGCKHIFWLGAAFYLLSALIIRSSSLPSLLLAARIVQAVGALATIAVAVYSFYTAGPILSFRAMANPSSGFRHLFLILAAGIVVGGLSNKMTDAAVLLWTLPTAVISLMRPLFAKKPLGRATAFSITARSQKQRHNIDSGLFSAPKTSPVQIYVRPAPGTIQAGKK
jgi:MFS family permease